MIDINALFEQGAPEDVIADAVQKNIKEKALIEETKRQAEALRKAQSEKKTQLDYRKEGRAYLINALLAYDDAFNLFGPDPLDDDEIKELEKAIIKLEEMIPMYAKLLDLEKGVQRGDFGDLRL